MGSLTLSHVFAPDTRSESVQHQLRRLQVISDKCICRSGLNGKEMRFYAMKTKQGFPTLLPLTTFNDAANGYLIDDCCIFGAEVFVKSHTANGESVSFLKDPQIGYFTWKLDNFSKIDKDLLYSNVFVVSGRSWYVQCPQLSYALHTLQVL